MSISVVAVEAPLLVFPGLNVNLGTKGTYLNTGIPGTGIYDRKRIDLVNSSDSQPKNGNSHEDRGTEWEVFIPENAKGEIKSKNASEVTTQGLMELKESLVAANHELNSIKKEIEVLEKKVKNARTLQIFSKILLVGFLIKWFDTNYGEKKDYLDELRVQMKDCRVDIHIQIRSSS